MRKAVMRAGLTASALATSISFAAALSAHSGHSVAPFTPMFQARTAEAEMPRDPGALMEMAARTNGLAGEGVKPWHLKASYTVSDAKGAVLEQGTLEEMWAGSRKKRVTYTVGADSMTTYVTEEGASLSGKLARVSGLAQEAELQWTDPLPAIAYIERQTYEKREQKLGESKLACVGNGPGFQTYCFSAEKPILRIVVSRAGSQVIRNSIALFQGRYVPRDIEITTQNKIVAKVHLESLAGIEHVDEALWKPPADSQPMPKRIQISSGVATTMLLNQIRPIYPENAKRLGVSGTVVIEIRIGTDGHVYDAKVVSGEGLLQQAALDAVTAWVYRPYQLNGEVVEAETTVNIVFNLMR